jgi:chromosome segregation ATPase
MQGLLDAAHGDQVIRFGAFPVDTGIERHYAAAAVGDGEEGIMNERVGNGRAANRPKPRPDATTRFQRLQTRGGQLLQWFPELGKTLLRESEPSVEAVLSQIQSLRGEVRRRAGETGRDLEARAERLLSDLERQAIERLQPILSRAHVASQRDTEALEDRVAHLEDRLGPLLDDRVALSTRVATLEHQLMEARSELGERVREIDLRIAAAEDVRTDVAELRNQLDALAKDQLTRSLELGKLHDRMTRMEMRFGDLLKEHGTHLAEHEDVKKRLGALPADIENAARLATNAADQARHATAAAQVATDRLTALAGERLRERTDLEQLGERGLEIERIIRQIELRIGDLAERHTGVREELASLAARTAKLELTAAPQATASIGIERTEGH